MAGEGADEAMGPLPLSEHGEPGGLTMAALSVSMSWMLVGTGDAGALPFSNECGEQGGLGITAVPAVGTS